jgi:hypothetical protein
MSTKADVLRELYEQAVRNAKLAREAHEVFARISVDVTQPMAKSLGEAVRTGVIPEELDDDEVLASHLEQLESAGDALASVLRIGRELDNAASTSS